MERDSELIPSKKAKTATDFDFDVTYFDLEFNESEGKLLCLSDAETSDDPAISLSKAPEGSVQERLEVFDGILGNHGFNSAEHTFITSSHSIDGGSTRLHSTNDDLVLLNPTSLQVLSVDFASVAHVSKSTTVNNLQEEPNNQLHASAHQMDVPLQQPVATITSHMEQFIPQSVAHPILNIVNIQPETTGLESVGSTDVGPETTSHFLHNFRTVQPMPIQGLHLDIPYNESKSPMPLQRLHPNVLYNESKSLYEQNVLLSLEREDKKIQLKIGFEKEVDNIRRKYDRLIQDVETNYIQKKKHLDKLCEKVRMNQVSAANLNNISLQNNMEGVISYQGPLSSGLQFSQASMPQCNRFPAPAEANLTSVLPRSGSPSVRLRAPALAAAPSQLAHTVELSGSSMNYPVWHDSNLILPSHANFWDGRHQSTLAPHLRPSGPCQPKTPVQTGGMMDHQQSNQRSLPQLMGMDAATLQTALALLGRHPGR